MSLLNLDEKLSPKARQATYGVGFLGVGALILAQAFGAVSGVDADKIVDLVTVVGGLLGLGATGVARDALKNQRANGAVIGNVELPTVEVPLPPLTTVEVPLPPLTTVEVPLPPLTTVEKITQAVEEVAALDHQVKSGLDQLTQITGGLINVPGVLAMTPDLPGGLDDLVRGAGERYRK